MSVIKQGKIRASLYGARGFSLSKKSSENWAFSFRCGKIKKKGRKSEGNAGNRTDEQR